MKKVTTLCMSVLVSLTVGCSCFVPSHQTVSISVIEPPHAMVWVNGTYEGEAPVQVSLIRNRTFGVIVKKEGFQTSTKVTTITQDLRKSWNVLFSPATRQG